MGWSWREGVVVVSGRAAEAEACDVHCEELFSREIFKVEKGPAAGVSAICCARPYRS